MDWVKIYCNVELLQSKDAKFIVIDGKQQRNIENCVKSGSKEYYMTKRVFDKKYERIYSAVSANSTVGSQKSVQNVNGCT